MSEKSEIPQERKTSCVELTQHALRECIAPPMRGSVKARIGHASRRLGWSHNRTKDCWYADPRISISADEIKAIEQATGLEYGRAEIRTNDQLIAQAEALVGDQDFLSAFIAALREVAGAASRARASRD